MILFFKSFIVGLGKIIPGLSGSVIAINFGIYDKGIEAISDFFSNIKKNTSFLFVSGSGVVLAIVIGSILLRWILLYFYLPFIAFFIGILLSDVRKKYIDFNGNITIKDMIIIITVFLVFIFFNLNVKTIKNVNINIITYCIIGLLDAITMVIPGISGTGIFMMLGLYDVYLSILSNCLNINTFFHNFYMLVYYFVGLILGIIITSKVANYMFKNHKHFTHIIVLSLMLSTVLVLISGILHTKYSVLSYVLLFIFIIGGYMLNN